MNARYSYICIFLKGMQEHLIFVTWVDAPSSDAPATSMIAWSVIFTLTYLNMIVKLLTFAFQRNLTVISLTIEAYFFKSKLRRGSTKVDPHQLSFAYRDSALDIFLQAIKTGHHSIIHTITCYRAWKTEYQ